MSKLHRLDDVAYVRFASVYREFKDVADFIQTPATSPSKHLQQFVRSDQVLH